MSTWHTLYIPESNAISVKSAFDMALSLLGYLSYNPFGLMPTKPYKHTVRLFVAPLQEQWTRVIGEVPAEVCLETSSRVPILRMSLRAADYTIDGWTAKEPLDLEGWLHINVGSMDLRSLEAIPAPPRVVEKRTLVVPLEALPENVRNMAQGIDQTQAAKMFERISEDLMKKAGGDAAGAQALLDHTNAPDWNSPGGMRIQKLAEALNLGDGWREPDFVTLRDAYQAAARRNRRPDAPPLPGDLEAIAAVPNALDYIPVFAGKDA